MAKMRTIQSALNGGELSPLLRGRTDIPRYQHGLELCRNAIPMTWGGVQRIGGTRYKSTFPDAIARKIPFPISINGIMIGYAVELGNNRLQIHKSGSLITAAGIAYELATPYSTAELPNIRYDSSGNCLYLFHPAHAPQRMYRKTSDTDWVLETVPFTALPYLRPPGSEGIKLAPSATSGDISITADADWFTPAMVGTRLQVNGGICLITGYTDAKTVSATVEQVIIPDETTRILQDVVTIEYTPPEVPIAWELIVTASANYTTDELTVNPGGAPPVGVVVTKERTEAKLTGTEPDKAWKECAWSALRGWPVCGAFSEQRLVIGGTPTYPTYLIGSKSGDPLDFTIGTLDSDAWAFNLAEISTSIYHVLPTGLLAVFAGDKEMTVRGGADTPITPTNVQAKGRTPHGTGLVRPVLVGSECYFVPLSGNKLRNFDYQLANDKYTAVDVAMLAEHLVGPNGGLVEMAYTREPYSLLWIITGNGTLLTLTLDKEQEVAAWASHGGNDCRYISVVVTPGDDGQDQVQFDVQRLVDGTWRTYSELLDWNVMTNSSVSAAGAGMTEMTGLDHLENCLVDVVADGFYAGRLTVTDGKVSLPFPANTVTAGLPYKTIIKDLPLELVNPGQSVQGAAVSVDKIRVRLDKSQGCTVNADPVPFRSWPEPNIPVQPFTGDKTVHNLGAGTDPAESQVTIEQDLPFPLTVLAIIKEVTING